MFSKILLTIHDDSKISLGGVFQGLIIGIVLLVTSYYLKAIPFLNIIGLLLIAVSSLMLVIKTLLKGTVVYSNSKKQCPKCSESVKAEAKICKHCSYEFES